MVVEIADNIRFVIEYLNLCTGGTFFVDCV